MMSDPSDPSILVQEGLPENTDQLGVIEAVGVIGRFVWELMGRSIWRMVFIFTAVFLATFLPSILLILWLTFASQTYTRGGWFFLS